jgi:hypothetical protein
VLQSCTPSPPAAGQAEGRAAVGAQTRTLDACLARLTRQGYRQHVVYQPLARFWHLQWAGTGLYLAVSALLAALSFWWTRRRLS